MFFDAVSSLRVRLVCGCSVAISASAVPKEKDCITGSMEILFLLMCVNVRRIPNNANS